MAATSDPTAGVSPADYEKFLENISKYSLQHGFDAIHAGHASLYQLIAVSFMRVYKHNRTLKDLRRATKPSELEEKAFLSVVLPGFETCVQELFPIHDVFVDLQKSSVNDKNTDAEKSIIAFNELTTPRDLVECPNRFKASIPIGQLNEIDLFTVILNRLNHIFKTLFPAVFPKSMDSIEIVDLKESDFVRIRYRFQKNTGWPTTWAGFSDVISSVWNYFKILKAFNFNKIMKEHIVEAVNARKKVAFQVVSKGKRRSVEIPFSTSRFDLDDDEETDDVFTLPVTEPEEIEEKKLKRKLAKKQRFLEMKTSHVFTASRPCRYTITDPKTKIIYRVPPEAEEMITRCWNMFLMNPLLFKN